MCVEHCTGACMWARGYCAEHAEAHLWTIRNHQVCNWACVCLGMQFAINIFVKPEWIKRCHFGRKLEIVQRCTS